MTRDEFLSSMKSHDAIIGAPADIRAISMTNNALQSMRIAILPAALNDLYSVANGINLGAGYIFGLNEWHITPNTPIPSIVSVNHDLIGLPQVQGKTVFGRNDLFWFMFDAFGYCYMVNNTSLQPLRKYTDVYQAITDCLLGGKF